MSLFLFGENTKKKWITKGIFIIIRIFLVNISKLVCARSLCQINLVWKQLAVENAKCCKGYCETRIYPHDTYSHQLSTERLVARMVSAPHSSSGSFYSEESKLTPAICKNIRSTCMVWGTCNLHNVKKNISRGLS